MSKLYILSEFKVQSGKAEELKALAHAYTELVKAKDTGTHMYEFFLNEEESICQVLEIYESSEAALVHLGNIGPELGKLLAIGELSITVLGQASEALLNAAQGLSLKLYPKFIDGLDYKA